MPLGPLGIHAGVWGFDWSDERAERAISGASRAGFELIEIPALDPSRVDVAPTIRLLAKYGLDASVSLALDNDSDINTTNSETSDIGESRLLAAVDFAERIGATFVGGVVYSAMRRYLELPSESGRQNSLDVLRRVSMRAARSGITLGIEYVNRYESNLLNTVDQTLLFIEELGVENAAVHLDTFHAHIEEADILSAIKRAGHRLGYIHASESHRGELGTGSIDWVRIIDTLVGIEYRQPMVVETFSPSVISPAQSIEIGLWQTTWFDPDELAFNAHQFLTNLISRSTARHSVTT